LDIYEDGAPAYPDFYKPELVPVVETKRDETVPLGVEPAFET
jgi:hypothetical protein